MLGERSTRLPTLIAGMPNSGRCWGNSRQIARASTERSLGTVQEVFANTIKTNEAIGALAKGQFETVTAQAKAEVEKVTKAAKAK